MSTLNYTFLDKQDNTIFFKNPKGKLEIYIPKIYFELELATKYGMKIESLATFTFKYYPDADSNKFELYQFELPETIVFSYTEVVDSKEVLIKDSDENDYEVYTLYNGDMFVENIEIVKNFKNTEALLKLHFAGKIPLNIKYSSILKMYIESMQTNDCDLKVPSMLLECMIGELARYKKDKSIAFRKVVAKKNLSELDYAQISVKTLALLNSTFTAFTSENTKNILTYSIERTRNGGTELETPIEEVTKY